MMSIELASLELDIKTQVGPFVKWAGGKSQLLEQFEPLLPARFNKYVEPFVGGGAVFFRLYNQGRIGDGVILNDLNEELMTCYEVIRDQVDDLIEELLCHESFKMEEDYFYKVREWDRKTNFHERSPVERAARMIFLNCKD